MTRGHVNLERAVKALVAHGHEVEENLLQHLSPSLVRGSESPLLFCTESCTFSLGLTVTMTEPRR